MKASVETPGTKYSVPTITLCITAISLMLTFSSTLSQFIQYDRAAITNGELWRLVTGHWVHWSFRHMLWCSITFLALGSVCETISPRGYLTTLTLASLAIPMVLWIAEPGMHTYRGLSGLASAVFVYSAMLLVHNAFTDKDAWRFFLSAAAGAGYVMKILFEFITGSTVFVETTDIFSPAPLAHLAGGAVGILVYLWTRHTKHAEFYSHSSPVPTSRRSNGSATIRDFAK